MVPPPVGESHFLSSFMYRFHWFPAEWTLSYPTNKPYHKGVVKCFMV